MLRSTTLDPVTLYAIARLIKTRKKCKRLWIHNINEQREIYGEFGHLVMDLRLDENRFKTYFRMTPTEFDILLSKVSPLIQKRCSNFRQPSDWL